MLVIFKNYLFGVGFNSNTQKSLLQNKNKWNIQTCLKNGLFNKVSDFDSISMIRFQKSRLQKKEKKYHENLSWFPLMSWKIFFFFYHK